MVVWHTLRRDGGRAHPPPAGLKATETAESNGVIYRETPPGRTKPETAEKGLIPHAKPTREGATRATRPATRVAGDLSDPQLDLASGTETRRSWKPRRP